MSAYKLLSPEKAAKLLTSLLPSKQRVIPVDSSWYMPNMNRNGKEEYLKGPRLPNAVYFDIDDIKNHNLPYPHMLPDLQTFNKKMSELGLLPSDILIVYDNIGNFSSPRCAWTLTTLGHKDVYLLNTFAEYKALNLPLEYNVLLSANRFPKTNYESVIDHTEEQVVTYEEMERLFKDHLLKTKYNVYDARSLGRYLGKCPEPRPNFPSGHIPGTLSLPFTTVVDNKKFNKFDDSKEEIQNKINTFLKENNFPPYDPTKPTICMCGTGVSGVIIKTALENSGIKNIKLYDGSWTEWILKHKEGSKEDQNYIATGNAN
ncbi:related to Thiosulfate sulfurtransferase TUM1 [Saccharomycodes ludwigii]|uniref:Related to Thiosulfate sulfurtransferase TUM1 n=1 Tax=Saccharomycodes ludwigii TaxID=36035 RepID=A0A376BB75_9ASCO|nr:hypothetical protein SCDLUD_002175 [Saccharomycodes ludwigii]KAH3902355.1 hypothetical protein SCDLUD_002175 [Saccharomycodes ludwigii]SSD61400.1 related to Thiosulfate sulfurtransferase TUM1 [Saccharomycodes ludwigii]